MNSRTSSRATLTLIFGMIFFFGLSLRYQNVDRTQEYVYLCVPYQSLQNHQLFINKWTDPFGENGPLGVYPPAACALYGSLGLMRWYQFLFSIAAMVLLMRIARRATVDGLDSPVLVAHDALSMLTVWITIPLVLIYPVQCNGMFAGLLCFIGGLFLMRERPYSAMFLFGFAYSFKTQWLGMLPGIVLYQFLMQPVATSWAARFKEIGMGLLVYFLPACVIVPVMFAPLGAFRSFHDFWVYAMNGPHEFWIQIEYHGARLLRGGMPAAHQARVDDIRISEFKGYGLLTWSHIALSFGFSVALSVLAVWKRWFTKRPFVGPLSTPMIVLASCGLFYWVHFLVIYRYPYWYNVFPMVIFNPLLVAIGFRLLLQKITSGGPYRFAWTMVVGIMIVEACILGRTAWKLPGAHRNSPPGNSLTPYDWMVGSK